MLLWSKKTTKNWLLLGKVSIQRLHREDFQLDFRFRYDWGGNIILHQIIEPKCFDTATERHRSVHAPRWWILLDQTKDGSTIGPQKVLQAETCRASELNDLILTDRATDNWLTCSKQFLDQLVAEFKPIVRLFECKKPFRQLGTVDLFTPEGDDFHFFRFKTLPLTDRKKFFEESLEALKAEKKWMLHRLELYSLNE